MKNYLQRIFSKILSGRVEPMDDDKEIVEAILNDPDLARRIQEVMKTPPLSPEESAEVLAEIRAELAAKNNTPSPW